MVSVGEGIYHLFHHKSSIPANPSLPKGNVSVQDSISNNLTQKYANSLPSMDSSVEGSASVMSF